MAECGEDHRFPIQQIALDRWERATRVNAAADWMHGGRSAVEDFFRPRAEFAPFARQLSSWSSEQLSDYVEAHRGESVGFLVLMMTGQCNADCTICFTDRRKKAGELSPEERIDLLRQAKRLGAQFVYVPGEGEPTIDGGFWSFLEVCREVDLPAIVFTNGLLLSDDDVCQRYWGMDTAAAVRKLADYPVSFYVKHWSTDPTLVGDMMQIDASRYHFTEFDGVPVHAGLHALLTSFPRERLGLEIVVERRNADEVVRTLVPFAEKHGLARIVEMIQHNGRVFGDGAYDPTDEQAEAAQPLLSPTSCHLATCKAVVTSRGYLSPRIAILENQLPPERQNVRNQDLFTLLHTTDYIVSRRYVLSCLCEQVPLELAGAQGRLRSGPTSIVPRALRIIQQ